MNSRTIEIVSRRNRNIVMNVIQGHFATTNSHINYFLDTTQVKSMHKMAKEVSKVFAGDFRDTPIEAIVCTERTKMIGAFLAEELSLAGINRDQDIVVVTPEFNSFNKMLLRDNVQSLIWNKNVLVLSASIATGITASSVLDGINYYGATPAGIATIFSTRSDIDGVPVRSIFDNEDVPGYENCSIADCPLCKRKVKIDAIVNSYGYSKL